jgi:malonyl CoA-acyl carrier protein transacylase
MRAVGIQPDGIMGLSLGELGCSYMDNCFSAEQVALAAYYCGCALLETELIRDSMAAVCKPSAFSGIAQEYVCQHCMSAAHPPG